ncbi:hypothetical protein ACA910_008171 [Epithemia clementina (nom. ined.)]
MNKALFVHVFFTALLLQSLRNKKSFEVTAFQPQTPRRYDHHNLNAKGCSPPPPPDVVLIAGNSNAFFRNNSDGSFALTSSTQLRLATSSSELKKTQKKRQSHKSNDPPTRRTTNNNNNQHVHEDGSQSFDEKSSLASIAKRLSHAAKRAQEKKKRREEQEQYNSSSTSGRQNGDNTDDPTADSTTHDRTPMVSLQELTRTIDERLRASQSSPEQMNRDSMTSVIRHNQKKDDKTRPFGQTYTSPQLNSDTTSTDNSNSTNKSTETDREVAIVLAKPLQEDLITVQYANRIRRLVRAMISNDEEEGEPYRPDVICFVGPQSPGNILVDADAGYMYFQYLTMTHGVSIEGIDIHLVKGSVREGALQQISSFLQETCLPAWLRASQKAADDEAALNGHDRPPEGIRIRHRLKVHFSLISSEYELCQLNDIHIRSPGQSVLRALESWSQRSFVTTWSYMYVTTVLPAKDASNPAQAFCAKTYKTAQQLLPVLQNLRNVVSNREFFQTESYRVLVAARRSLVSDMEALYTHQPRLKAVHNWRKHSSGGIDSSQPVDVVLEGALLLIGRCLDIVRPAGLLTGASVSLDDWKLALVVLRQAFVAITTVCDPDRPLEPDEWMLLGDDDD